MQKLFSILIPVYNVENLIKECIESVINQTYQNIEIILINDGSTDASGNICVEYAKKDKRIKVYHQRNQGLIMARRNAIAKASGDYLLFLDSDDYWDYDLLETISQIIYEYDCDLVIYKFKRVSEMGVFISEAKSVFKDKMIFNCDNKEQLFKKIINSSDLNNLVCKAVKRSNIDNTDYSQYKKIKNAEDLLQSIPLLYSAEKIVYIDKPMYNYRMVSTSMTQIFNFNLVNDITTVRGILLQYIKKLKIDNEENLKLFYYFYIQMVLNYTFELVNSSITRAKKMGMLNRIQNIQLYVDALNYFDIASLSLEKKILLYLFNKKHYQLLFAYARSVGFLKRSIKFILFRKKGM